MLNGKLIDFEIKEVLNCVVKFFVDLGYYVDEKGLGIDYCFMYVVFVVVMGVYFVGVMLECIE